MSNPADTMYSKRDHAHIGACGPGLLATHSMVVVCSGGVYLFVVIALMKVVFCTESSSTFFAVLWLQARVS